MTHFFHEVFDSLIPYVNKVQTARRRVRKKKFLISIEKELPPVSAAPWMISRKAQELKRNENEEEDVSYDADYDDKKDTNYFDKNEIPNTKDHTKYYYSDSDDNEQYDQPNDDYEQHDQLDTGSSNSDDNYEQHDQLDTGSSNSDDNYE